MHQLMLMMSAPPRRREDRPPRVGAPEGEGSRRRAAILSTPFPRRVIAIGSSKPSQPPLPQHPLSLFRHLARLADSRQRASIKPLSETCRKHADTSSSLGNTLRRGFEIPPGLAPEPTS